MPKNRCRLARPSRIALLLTALVFTFALQTATSFAARRDAKPSKTTHASHRSAGAKKAHAAGALPDQGIFDNCVISQSLSTCEQDLQQMHQAGLQVAVVGMQGDSLADLSSYASYAQSIGMSVMWQINDPGFWGGAWVGSSAAADWNQFSSACGCTGTTQVLNYMIQYLGAMPATYGYYAADDYTLTAGQVGGIRQYVSEIKSVDPNHMVMVGSSQSMGTAFYTTGATIGNEIYPETTNSLLPYDRNLATWQSVQDSVTQDQRVATQDGTSSAFILQAFSFGDNLDDGEAVGVCKANMTQPQCANLLQYPSAGVQLALRNQVLENAHPKLILWFNFSEAAQGSHWGDLTSVVRAQYPVSASAARAKRAHKAARKHGARRRSVGHTLAV